jgi:pimeloyl-ACP methyl ester carboxylesterase
LKKEKKIFLIFLILVIPIVFTGFILGAEKISWKNIRFKAGKTVVDAQRGTFFVPENRSASDSRKIKLSFVRFKATCKNPGYPIVYLAGGPGGSGEATARRSRFPLFMALRQVADVIAFDQRGTGRSNDIPVCDTGLTFPLNKAVTRKEVVELYKKGISKCLDFWKSRGIDLRGYTTLESARDLHDLKEALGVKKISLWGISYGTHLALAAIKLKGDWIDRVIMASPEGLEQTVKLPARTDLYFKRVQKVIDQNPRAAKIYPDVAGLIKRVLDRLKVKPAFVKIKDEKGVPLSLSFGRFEVQLLTGYSISDPERLPGLLKLYKAMDQEIYEPAGQLIYKNLRRKNLVLRAMPLMMDIASGISGQRLNLVKNQAKTSLLGDALNFPMPHLAGLFGEIPDLGDVFRENVQTDVPALFLTGTLDGRTYPEAHEEIMQGFSQATQIIVENAGHNIFMVSPEITKIIVSFMKGKPINKTHLKIAPPKFVN